MTGRFPALLLLRASGSRAGPAGWTAAVGSGLLVDQLVVTDPRRGRFAVRSGARAGPMTGWGLFVRPHDDGLRVFFVATGSPAAAAGIREGDYVRVKGGGHEPDSVSRFYELLAGRDEVELEFGCGDSVREARLQGAAYLPSVEFRSRAGR